MTVFDYQRDPVSFGCPQASRLQALNGVPHRRWEEEKSKTLDCRNSHFPQILYS